MSVVSYVNGLYVPHADAAVHVEDRGLQFADGVYEVVAVREGRLVDWAPHAARLGRSLDALRIPLPMAPAALRIVVGETVRRNRVRAGAAYVQVTRGRAARAHAFPVSAEPSLIVTARSLAPPLSILRERGVTVITVPDIRWGRCDIKSVSLLPNVLARQAAAEAGADEAWLVDAAGSVTEGSSSNAWMVDAAGTLVTRELSYRLLGGVTRAAVLAASVSAGLAVEERAFTVGEALAGTEALLTSTTAGVLPVTLLDGQPVGPDGRPGPVFRRLQALYAQHLRRETEP